MPAQSPTNLDSWITLPLLVEVGLVASAIGVAGALGGRGRRWSRFFWKAIDGVARRSAFAVALVGGISFVGCLLVGLFGSLPEPSVHDEFSYILAADTFASGRLTNPTPADWQHFETLQVIMTPSYQSKYPPGQGLMLALGQRLTGDPASGIWLGTALACAALCWMLQGWLPARWALAGGLLAVARFGIDGSWAQTYWGGCVAVLGGALAWGALPRLLRAPSLGSSFALGAGLGILSLTRPYEGLIASVPVLAILAVHAVRPSTPARFAWIARALVPAAVLALAALAFQMVYNRAVTGSATRSAYFEHQRQYEQISPWLWGKPSQPPEYRHEVLRQFHEDEARPVMQRQQQGMGVPFLEIAWKLWRVAIFPFGAAMLLFLVLLVPVARHRAGRIGIAAVLLGAAGIAGLTFVFPHYAAPLTPVVALLILIALRHVHALHTPRFRFGPAAAAGILFTFVLVLGLGLALRSGSVVPFGHVRAHVQQELEESPGDDLVIVKYGRHHWCHMEWVYNRADIDRAPVIWARDMGEEKNAELVDRHRARRAWILHVDRDDQLPVREAWRRGS